MDTQSITEEPRLFLSYSRRNTDFVDELIISVESYGFDVQFDRADLFPGEPWEPRLRGLISEADTTVCVLSNEWLASGECIKELKIALELGRRVIPVLIDPVDPSTMPPELARLQFVFFHGEDHSYARGVVDLIDALRTDIGWVREQTRMLDKANEWHRSGQSPALLLRGGALDGAMQWIGERAPEHTHVLPILADYIQASDANRKSDEKKRLQGRFWFATLIGLVIAGLLGVALLFLQVRAKQDRIDKAEAETEAQRVRADNAELEKQLMLADLGNFDEEAEEEIIVGLDDEYVIADVSENGGGPSGIPMATLPPPDRGLSPNRDVPGAPTRSPVRTPSAAILEVTLVSKLNDSDKTVRLQAGQEVAEGLRQSNNDALLRDLVAQLETPRLLQLSSSGRFNVLYMLNSYDGWAGSSHGAALTAGLERVEQTASAGSAVAIGSQTRDCLTRLGQKLAGQKNVGDRCGGR